MPELKPVSTATTTPAHLTTGEWVHRQLQTYERPLTTYAQRLTGNLEVAREVVQEAFLRLCRSPRSQVDGHVGPWLYTVCRRRALDHRRKEKRMSPLTDAALAQHASPQTEPSGEVEQADDLAAVLRALDDLPPPQQEVIRLKFQHGLSYREIAAVTEQPIGTVGYLIHVGLQTIRQVVVPQA